MTARCFVSFWFSSEVLCFAVLGPVSTSILTSILTGILISKKVHILDNSRMFGKLGSLWVCLGHLGPLRAFAGLFKGNCGASCPRGPGRLEPACNFEQFERLERQLEFRAGSHQFRATHRYFEQAACISSKVNHGLIRTNPWSFEQPT